MSPHSAGGKTPDEWTAAYGKRELPEPPPYAGYLNEHGVLVRFAGPVVSLGIDPGPVPGIFLACWEPGKREAAWARAYQCNASTAGELLDMLLAEYAPLVTCGQIEEFRTGRGAGTRGKSASVTREMVIALTAQAAGRGVTLAVRHSSGVFPWASDKRLVAAGIWDATAQLVHARAASRHCLFAAVHDGGLPDPLSKKVP